MFNRTIMFILFLGSFSVIWGFAGVAEAWPYQQGRDGPTITSVHKSDLQGSLYIRPTESYKPTASKYYVCYDADICETGVQFCSERRRACEKCADYEAACGTNFQKVNCTQYCMKILMERKCNETMITKLSLTTTEQTLNYTKKTDSSALTNNPETCFHLKWICVTVSLVIALATSLSCNVYQHCHGKQTKQTERTNEEETGLLKDRLTDVLIDTPISKDRLTDGLIDTPISKDRLTDGLIDTPISLDFISDQNTSACLMEDESRLRSLMPSAPFMQNENLDMHETSIKSHNKRLPRREPEDVEPNLGRERQDDPRDTMDDLRGPEVDTDIQSSSGCSSASSTLSRTGSGVTSKTTININIHNGQTGLSTTPTEAKKNAIQPENPRKEIPFGVEETDADFNHGKLVSDEEQHGRLALPEISADIDFKKAPPNG